LPSYIIAKTLVIVLTAFLLFTYQYHSFSRNHLLEQITSVIAFIRATNGLIDDFDKKRKNR
jgi:hypothetical protein